MVAFPRSRSLDVAVVTLLAVVCTAESAVYTQGPFDLLVDLQARYAKAGHILEEDFVRRLGSNSANPESRSTHRSVRVTKLAVSAASSLKTSIRPAMAVQFGKLEEPACTIPEKTKEKDVPACFTSAEYEEMVHKQAQNLIDQGLLTPNEVISWTKAAGRLAEKLVDKRCPSELATKNIDRLRDNLKLSSLGQPNCLQEATLRSYAVAGADEDMIYSFTNASGKQVDLHWIDYEGEDIKLYSLDHGTTVEVTGRYGDAWKMTDPKYENSCVDAFRATVASQHFSVGVWSSLNWW